MKRETLIIILVLAVLVTIVLAVLIIINLKFDKGINKEFDSDTQEQIDELFGDQETSDDCASDIYNCDDLTTQQDAQDMFELCGGINNDIHGLDGNNDGVVCESLP